MIRESNIQDKKLSILFGALNLVSKFSGKKNKRTNNLGASKF